MIVGPLIFSVAAFGTELRVSEVWCLQPHNRESVVSTASYEGLGKVGGNGGLYVPFNSSDERGLTAEQWRQQRPSEFTRLCDKTYRALTGNSIEPEQMNEDQLSDIEEAVISAGVGAVVALLGVGGGYGVTRLTSRSERRNLRAGALTLANANLQVALRDLPAKIGEGTASADEKAEASRLAVSLDAQLPKEPKEEVAKVSAKVKSLTDALKASDAASLDTAGIEVARAVGELVGKMSKEAKLKKA